ncbi:hypothetical protein Salat_0217200 [Sesamum alatum]|uniref:Myb/SANT-like domain-containing protein n=1 Tax=Sesamum alatum TaxID=300844 RepID=A0AAE1Z000_9LAMI|nr:hypothetical protein Salat_0217200 [Sesamum alatum]
MEKTFVDSLVEQNEEGNFHKYGTNCHVIMCALYDVNKVHRDVIGYSFGKRKLQDLKEQHGVFSWIMNFEGVNCNHERRYVIAADEVWETIIKERVIAKCYVNAYEDQYAKFCVLFGPDHLDTELGKVDNDVESFAVVSCYLAELTQDGITTRVPHTVNFPADGSVDSTSLWRFLEHYYPSDEDEADSILSLPGVPRGPPTATNDIPISPIASYVSVEHPSSSASNDFPYPSK